MSILNSANRQAADVDIRRLSDKKPFLFFDTANVTTAGFSSDTVYAMAKGARRIGFQNPLEGTMTFEAQVYPMELYALFTNSGVEGSAAYAMTQTVKCTTAGQVTLVPGTDVVEAGTIFVYPKGDPSAVIDGSFLTNVFTATTAADIASGSEYTIAYIAKRSAGVKKVSINNVNLPDDYYITYRTASKTDNGLYAGFIVKAYKATIDRNLDLSFSSEGDPASITISFSVMEDKDGNFLDIIEEDEATSATPEDDD